MLKNSRPGIDGAIEPLNGVTRDGQPLSYNRAPTPDLAPWIARLYATVIIAPADHRLDCGLFSDAAILRYQLKGKWQAHAANGLMEFERPAALFFGPQTRRMAISVTGSFVSLGIVLRPGTGHAWLGANAADFLDRILPCEEIGLPGDAVLQALDLRGNSESWIRMMEDVIRLKLQQTGFAKPDPITARFESLAFTDPNASISEFARACGVDQRKLERIVHRDFGLAPKQVLRRARALDMASHLRGVADEREGAEFALRYYDQSHLIREFTELFGMSPSHFVTKSLPLLTIDLESRQARRLEAIERLKPGELRPWQARND